MVRPAFLIFTVLTALAGGALAQTPAPGEAWKSSPFNGMTNGDGKRIPCLCRYKDRDFRVGEAVCMQTHMGVVIARCDLFLNNTTWAPTNEPCTVSQRPMSPVPRG